MLPELPDAKMDTRKPIGCPLEKTLRPEGLSYNHRKTNFLNDGRAFHGRQRKREITIYVR
jgi:hypothetical protein